MGLGGLRLGYEFNHTPLASHAQGLALHLTGHRRIGAEPEPPGPPPLKSRDPPGVNLLDSLHVGAINYLILLNTNYHDLISETLALVDPGLQ